MNGVISNLFGNSDLVKETKELIQEMYLADKIPWVIGYSGGKDSTATTQIIIDTLLDMKHNSIELKKDVYIITSDTLVENPMIIGIIRKTIDGINELASLEKMPISAQIIYPEYEKSFWTNLIGKGYPCPNQSFRWCTDRLKIEPANKFINSVVSNYGEAVMILGVRDKESNSRDRVLETHTIEGKKMMRHTTMPNAYVFAPIRKFTLDDVWNYLLQNPSPWGIENRELFKLYSDSSPECPLIIDETTKNDYGSCGKSRFGCWVCTVVKKDKSLSGFISNGVLWLKPLLDYRNWLYNVRDKEDFRMKRRTNGTVYFSKIKKIDENKVEIPAKGDRKKLFITYVNNSWVDINGNTWVCFEGVTAEIEAKKYISENNIDLDSGQNPRIMIKKMDDQYYQLGNGPFTLFFRKQMLIKLLSLQKKLEIPHTLIRKEELFEIQKNWQKEGDWNSSVKGIYREVYNAELLELEDNIQAFSLEDMSILEEICKTNNFNSLIYAELIHNSKKNLGYISRKDAIKDLQRILNKEIAHFDTGGLNENK